MKHVILATALMGLMLTGCTQKSDNNQNNESMNTTLKLTQEWDKTFPKSDKVDHTVNATASMVAVYLTIIPLTESS